VELTLLFDNRSVAPPGLTHSCRARSAKPSRAQREESHQGLMTLQTRGALSRGRTWEHHVGNRTSRAEGLRQRPARGVINIIEARP